ncbi:MAG: hypothetical protein K9G58_00960 [Bacteroidales bacterium]|nr:hypothetical protein [Bacteroidales bacterium]MCF8388960.1 hypothetical protein [Bacteroidales bacterium]MCF8396705.1 hypothetical protein [Bacteroidales bacterium]
MNEIEIRDFILNHLKDRLEILGIHEREIRRDFDFVQSGLLDSMAFVDMVTAMEEHFEREVNFEEKVEDAEFTTMKGILKAFEK